MANTEKNVPEPAPTPDEPSRSRTHATVVYPESAPSDWRDILAGMHIPALISPLHDRYTNPDGTTKKPHYHVMLMYTSVKSRRQAMEVISQIGGVGDEMVRSQSSYARYLIHADDPDKAQYDAANVIALSGANYEVVAQMSKDENTVREMVLYIRDNQITSFADFTELCAMNNEEWFRVMVSKNKTYFLREYIKSMSWRVEHNIVPKKSIINDTGGKE